MSGSVRVPGDKSIAHRALILASVAEGTSRLAGLPDGADVRATRRVLERLGLRISGASDPVLVEGRGWPGLDQDGPRSLDCGNSGTTARLMLGLLAGRSGRFLFGGDDSLGRRPMARVVEPLRELGARVSGGATLPLELTGGPLRARDCTTAVASAQVKSCLILALLQAEGVGRVREAAPTRDHTERMLRAMDAPIRGAAHEGGIEIRGGCPRLRPLELQVPGDPSSAAFLVALATLLEDSELTVEGLSTNPTRLGFYRLLARMGGDVQWTTERDAAEPSGRLIARSAKLHAIELDSAQVVQAVDEIPLVALLGALAEGRTIIRGARELRLKESDRIRSTVALLRAFGAQAEELEDGLWVQGPTALRGAAVDAHGDHRIALCAAIAASIARGPTELTGAEWIDVSYPGFFEQLAELGAS